MKPHLFLAALAATGALTGTTECVAAPACSEDADCDGMLLCREARCVQVHCRNDSQCPAGRMCVEELCRIRQCYTDTDCTVDRRCLAGMCAIPQPGLRDVSEPVVTGVARLSAGPFFPLGLQAQADLPLGDNRWVVVGVGSAVTTGGLSWRLALRGAQVSAGPFDIDAWAGAMGLNASARPVGTNASAAVGAPTMDPVATLLGGGRWLFASGRDIHAVWWGGGASALFAHGAARERFIRLTIGLLLLFDDVYPTARDFALLPTFGVQYGWQFGLN